MNIGIVTTWFARGAAYVSRQIKDVLDREHSVSVFVRGGEKQAKGDPVWNGPEIFWSRPVPGGESTEFSLKEFERWVGTNKIDMVIFNEQKWWEGVQFCSERGITNGAYVDFYSEDSLKIFGLHDFIICNTRRHYCAFEWHPGASYIPWGTDIQLFLPQSFDPVDPAGLVFHHSAGMAPVRKGTDSVIKAFSMIRNVEAKLFIHTQVDLHRLIPEVGELMDRLENSGRLAIQHETVEPPGLYHLGDVYVYPTRRDGLGLSMAEALACGLPLITVDHPPMREFYNEECGSLTGVRYAYCPSDGFYWPSVEVDIEDLAEKMALWAERHGEISGYKRAARRFAESDLDWTKNSSGLLEVVKAVQPASEAQKRAALIAMEKHNLRKRGRLKSRFMGHPRLFRLVRRLLHLGR